MHEVLTPAIWQDPEWSSFTIAAAEAAVRRSAAAYETVYAKITNLPPGVNACVQRRFINGRDVVIALVSEQRAYSLASEGAAARIGEHLGRAVAKLGDVR
jgi:hypothetical protein